MVWLRNSQWHYAIRLPCDVLLHGTSRYPRTVGSLYPPLGEALLVSSGRFVGGWNARCNLVVATVKAAMTRGLSSLMRRRVYKPVAICFEVS